MKKSTKKIIVIIIIAIIAVMTLVGYVLWNKPHRNVRDASGIKVTAADLYNSFISDSAKARALYTDKVVEVSGEIIKINLNQQQQQIIFLKTAVDGAYINCTMEEDAEGHNVGEKILIKGICSGYIGGDADMGLPGDVILVRGYHSD
jgi:tRNA_anti-like